MKAKNYPVYLLCAYIVIWILLGITPYDRFTWILENILPLAVIPVLIYTYPRFRFSNSAYTLMFIFGVLHAIGSHYTYSHTPFFSEINGHRLSRDHYDRVIHFTFGLLTFLPMLELVSRPKIVVHKWRFVIAWFLIVSLSGLYEIMEWGAAATFSAEKAMEFTGTQGDPFDSQKDMILAASGAMISMFFIFFKTSAKPRKSLSKT